MGIFFSRSKSEPDSKKQNEPAKKRVLDPKDYKFIGLKNEKAVKLPNSISGQMFAIKNCISCEIYLLDYSGAVTIDGCEDCKIFIGPCDGSVFLRTSKNCSLIAACQQFRVRDCTECECSLHCSTQPVIESSDKITFSCFHFYYNDLQNQFSAAHISIFHNEWNAIYDFTSKEGTPHWSVSTRTLTHTFDGDFLHSLEVGFDEMKNTVPLIGIGGRKEMKESEERKGSEEKMKKNKKQKKSLVILFTTDESIVVQFLHALEESEIAHIMRLKNSLSKQSQLLSVLPIEKQQQVKADFESPIIVDIRGDVTEETIHSVWASFSSKPDHCLAITEIDDAKKAIKAFFGISAAEINVNL